MAFKRYVALGDSFTEGVGDPDPTRPNAVRGWADRVAEVLGGCWSTEYANLAIRGRKLGQVAEEQVAPALALAPDLVTIYAGANDILRPSVDIDALMSRYDETIRALRTASAASGGTKVLVWTAFGARKSRFYSMLRGRFAYYNECVREIVDNHGATLLDYWRMDEYDEWGYWDIDRLHMATPGHQLMATKVLDVLGLAHDLPAPRPLHRPTLSTAEQRAANIAWTREHLGPWVKRRVTGTSSGDGLSPRYPTPVVLSEPRVG